MPFAPQGLRSPLSLVAREERAARALLAREDDMLLALGVSKLAAETRVAIDPSEEANAVEGEPCVDDMLDEPEVAACVPAIGARATVDRSE